MIWTDAIAINKLCKLNFNVFYHVLSYKSSAGSLCFVYYEYDVLLDFETLVY